MKPFYKDILIISSLVIIILLITKNCYKENTINNDNVYKQLVDQHTKLKTQYSKDSLNFKTQNTIHLKEITKQKNELSVLNQSKNTLQKSYNNIYNRYKSSLDETNDIPMTICDSIIETGNELHLIKDSIINKQDSIITNQDSLIVDQLDYIIIQEIRIINTDSLLINSNELYRESNVLYQKTLKKLKRTRKIAIVGFFTGIGIGVVGTLLIK